MRGLISFASSQRLDPLLFQIVAISLVRQSAPFHKGVWNRTDTVGSYQEMSARFGVRIPYFGRAYNDPVENQSSRHEIRGNART